MVEIFEELNSIIGCNHADAVDQLLNALYLMLHIEFGLSVGQGAVLIWDTLSEYPLAADIDFGNFHTVISL